MVGENTGKSIIFTSRVCSTWCLRCVLDLSLFSEYVWGVLDILPDTDFPDFRHISVMQSQTGSVLIIPRERGLIRLYVQLENQADLFDSNGAVIREKATADTILDVSKSEGYQRRWAE
jgi:hypothetical protein